jgi:RNA polymerase sigma-70 factor (ECF subfamily)
MPDEPPDREIIAQAQAGDGSAFGKLYEWYHGQIDGYIGRMVGNDEVGYELAQETFIKAWKAIPSLRDSSCFTSWLYRIARNVAYDYLRHQERCKEPESVEDITIAGPEEQVEENQLLKSALALVSPKYRACVILYCVEEYSHREIAERLGIKESSVSKYVSRGLEQLRQIYDHLMNEQGPFVEGEREQ